LKDEHTPGPWRREKYRDSENYSLTIVADNPYGDKWGTWAVAHAHGWGGDDHHQSEANARLIAAAPDLLEACERMLPFLVEFCNLYPAHSDQVAVPRAFALGNARAAIAKAQG
jgi:hypothetical protein